MLQDLEGLKLLIFPVMSISSWRICSSLRWTKKFPDIKLMQPLVESRNLTRIRISILSFWVDESELEGYYNQLPTSDTGRRLMRRRRECKRVEKGLTWRAVRSPTQTHFSIWNRMHQFYPALVERMVKFIYFHFRDPASPSGLLCVSTYCSEHKREEKQRKQISQHVTCDGYDFFWKTSTIAGGLHEWE